MTKLINPTDGSKAIWQRSSTQLTALLAALKGVAPDTPWWGYVILSAVVIVAQQIWAPSVRRKDLPS